VRATIVKWGNSQEIRLPKHLLESAGIDEHDTLEIVAENCSIIIKKTNPQMRKTIKERFECFTGSYETEMADWGNPVGKEIW
jgi:antitoxin MazE